MTAFLTPQQALAKARYWCAKQERSHIEIRTKLFKWGLKSNQVENIIAELITGGFINEERFAIQYAGGKFRIKKWGRLKIQSHLKQKKISDYCMEKGLGEIREKDYRQTLEDLMNKKSRTLREKNPLLKKNKLVRYLLGKGYESELVWDVVNGKGL